MIDEHDTVSLQQLLFRILVFYALRDEHEQGRISGALRLPLPLSAEPNLNDGIFCRFTNFFLRTSKFRHSLTKSFSFWGTSSPDHLPGLSLDPTEDFRPPDLLAPTHILNTPLSRSLRVFRV